MAPLSDVFPATHRWREEHACSQSTKPAWPGTLFCHSPSGPPGSGGGASTPSPPPFSPHSPLVVTCPTSSPPFHELRAVRGGAAQRGGTKRMTRTGRAPTQPDGSVASRGLTLSHGLLLSMSAHLSTYAGHVEPYEDRDTVVQSQAPSLQVWRQGGCSSMTRDLATPLYSSS